MEDTRRGISALFEEEGEEQEEPTNLYSRQSTLQLNVPKSVTVIGVGGVGSWVALDLALTGVPVINVIDHDIVEEHNLNRTPFRRIDIGRTKVSAITSIVLERRQCDIRPIEDRIENVPEFLADADVIVDCRDTSASLSPALRSKVKIIGGYDGSNITIHVNPDYNHIWSDGDVTYRTVPSWLVPPQMIAAMITNHIVNGGTCQKEKLINLNIQDILEKL